MKRRNFLKTTGYSGVALGIISTHGLAELSTGNLPSCSDDRDTIEVSITYIYTYTETYAIYKKGNQTKRVRKGAVLTGTNNPAQPPGLADYVDSSDPNCDLVLTSVSGWEVPNGGLNVQGRPNNQVTQAVANDLVNNQGWGQFADETVDITVTWNLVKVGNYVCNNNLCPEDGSVPPPSPVTPPADAGLNP